MAPRRISRSQLNGYLDKLTKEEPVPELKLRQAAAQFGLDIEHLLAGSSRMHIKRDLVRFLSPNKAALEQWREAAEAQHASPRIDQAAMGNSHNARVSGALVTVRSKRQPHPQCIMVDAQGTIATPPGTAPAERLVIVENLENFLNLDGTLALLPSCGLGPEWQEADILYGGGNSITNHLLTGVFQQYREIGCLFDPDPGGIRMCDTLYQRGKLPPLRFLAPADLEERLATSSRGLSMDQREQLATHIRRSPPCAHVGGLIYTTGKHLEQESYLLSAPTTENAPSTTRG